MSYFSTFPLYSVSSTLLLLVHLVLEVEGRYYLSLPLREGTSDFPSSRPSEKKNYYPLMGLMDNINGFSSTREAVVVPEEQSFLPPSTLAGASRRKARLVGLAEAGEILSSPRRDEERDLNGLGSHLIALRPDYVFRNAANVLGNLFDFKIEKQQRQNRAEGYLSRKLRSSLLSSMRRK